MLKRTCLVLAAAVGAALSPALQAQPDGQVGLNAVLLRLFGEFPGFTAKAEASYREKGSSETVTMRFAFAMREGSARLDLDLAEVKSKQVRREELATWKRAGLDRLTTIVRADRKVALLIYPAVESYVELPLARDEAADLERSFRFEKSKLGQDRLDGHPCDRVRVRIVADSGQAHDATVWYATGLRNFPLKVQMNQDGATVVLQYRDVKLTKPDAAFFEAPPKFTRYPDTERLQQAAAFRMLQQGQ